MSQEFDKATLGRRLDMLANNNGQKRAFEKREVQRERRRGRTTRFAELSEINSNIVERAKKLSGYVPPSREIKSAKVPRTHRHESPWIVLRKAGPGITDAGAAGFISTSESAYQTICRFTVILMNENELADLKHHQSGTKYQPRSSSEATYPIPGWEDGDYEIMKVSEPVISGKYFDPILALKRQSRYNAMEAGVDSLQQIMALFEESAANALLNPHLQANREAAPTAA